MTNKEREECKRLVKEAKAQENENKLGENIFRVIGTPGNMKIIKIKKQ